MTKAILITGDCREVLRDLPDRSVEACVTDPPYELGFMGRKWDSTGIAYQIDVWSEVLRVLKPGAHLLAFGGTRTYHRMACAIEDAGFEIRDCLQWLYGQGFPKSLDVGKAIDKAAGAEREVVGRGKGRTGPLAQPHGGSVHSDDNYQWPGTYDITTAATDAAKQWQGWGTALKPANEPIVMARKPFAGTVAANVMEHGCGGINVDGCRIGLGGQAQRNAPQGLGYGSSASNDPTKNLVPNPPGRWPANVILTHHPECQPIGTRKVKGSHGKPEQVGQGSGKGAQHAIYGRGAGGGFVASVYTGPDGTETIEAWDCHPECPVRMLDEQSAAMGVHGAGQSRDVQAGRRYDATSYDLGAMGARRMHRFGDKGGASRFFYCAKASRKEREAGCEDLPSRTGAEATGRKEGTAGLNSSRASAGQSASAVRNHHPTVKPLKLMRYLVRLITPLGGLALDPFSGAGTTGIAAHNLGHNYIGIELNPEYNEIARARIKEAGGQVEVWE